MDLTLSISSTLKISLTKPIAIFLLFLTATPYLYFFLHSVDQNAARHEMEERLEKEILQTISVNLTDLKWAEEGKEAWIHDRMFDVKSIRYEGAKCILNGLFDDEETALVKNLIKHQQKHNAGGNKLIAGFFQLFKYTPTESFESTRIIGQPENRFPELSITIISHQPAVLVPPPRS